MIATGHDAWATMPTTQGNVVFCHACGTAPIVYETIIVPFASDDNMIAFVNAAFSNDATPNMELIANAKPLPTMKTPMPNKRRHKDSSSRDLGEFRGVIISDGRSEPLCYDGTQS